MRLAALFVPEAGNVFNFLVSLQKKYKLDHRPFALAAYYIVDTRVRKNKLRQFRNMRAAHYHRHIDSFFYTAGHLQCFPGSTV